MFALGAIFGEAVAEQQFCYENDCNTAQQWFSKAADAVVETSHATISNQTWWNEMKNSFAESNVKFFDSVGKSYEQLFENIYQFPGQLYDNVLSFFWYLLSYLTQLSWNISWTVVFATFKNLPYWMFPVIGFLCVVFANYIISWLVSFLFRTVSWTFWKLFWRFPKFCFGLAQKLPKFCLGLAQKCPSMRCPKIPESIKRFCTTLLEVLFVGASLTLICYLTNDIVQMEIKHWSIICEKKPSQCEHIFEKGFASIEDYIQWEIKMMLSYCGIHFLILSILYLIKSLFMKPSSDTKRNAKQSNGSTSTNTPKIVMNIPSEEKVLTATVYRRGDSVYTTMVIQRSNGTKYLTNIPDCIVTKKNENGTFSATTSNDVLYL